MREARAAGRGRIRRSEARGLGGCWQPPVPAQEAPEQPLLGSFPGPGTGTAPPRPHLIAFQHQQEPGATGEAKTARGSPNTTVPVPRPAPVLNPAPSTEIRTRLGGGAPTGHWQPPSPAPSSGAADSLHHCSPLPARPTGSRSVCPQAPKKNIKIQYMGGTAPAPQERAWLPAKGWGELGWIRPAIGPCCRTADPCSLGHIQGDKAQGRSGCGRLGAGSVLPAWPVRAGPVVRLQNGSRRLSGWGHRAVTPPREGTGPHKGSKTPGRPDTTSPVPPAAPLVPQGRAQPHGWGIGPVPPRWWPVPALTRQGDSSGAPKEGHWQLCQQHPVQAGSPGCCPQPFPGVPGGLCPMLGLGRRRAPHRSLSPPIPQPRPSMRRHGHVSEAVGSAKAGELRESQWGKPGHP